MKALVLRGLCAAMAVLLAACSQTPVTVGLNSLKQSGNVSFVCRADDGRPWGHLLNECPDREHGSRHMLALVTQTATDEVAIVDLSAGAVVDVDPGSPGETFLRVGAQPGAIVTTPGGAASFVGVTGLQKNGVFALPTTCLSAPEGTQKARDLTTWSACALTSAPGDISIVVDPEVNGMVRASCDGATQVPPSTQTSDKRDCPADLTGEGGPKGRRKLLVSLPDEHKVVVLDAQALLDRNPGEFKQCAVDATYELKAAVPTPPDQTLPVGLIPSPDAVPTDACVVTPYPPLDKSEAPTPGGFALADGTLYVADRTLPVVHRLDVSDPCAASEGAPLLPVSYLDKTRVVTTSRVAVSPLTPAGMQYVYAVDDSDQPAASVMVFDISPRTDGKTNNPTPIVFDHSELQPYSPPDRLRFNAPVRDVTFALRDFPKPDPTTGVGQFGVLCDPNPATVAPAPGALYRPNSDFSDGARPLNLRGVFGFAMLTNGQIAVIDVEDFDEPCRRPISMNTDLTPDFRGCHSDTPAPKGSPVPSYFTDTRLITGVPTVSDESSCNVIEPNRARSQFPSVSSTTNGLHAPTLRSFPQFSNPDPSSVVAADAQPRLLGVDFANPEGPTPIPAEVNISDQLYVNCPGTVCDNSAEKLSLDPNANPPNSVVLPLQEPRSYGPDDSPTLTFEGRLFPDRTSGFLQAGDASIPSQGLLQDPDASYCTAGVEDSDSILTEADELAIPTKQRSAWAAAHADYVQITGDFPVDTDVYWTVGAGQKCSYDACSNEFGTIDNPAALSFSRDMSIVQAYGDHLVVTPRCEQSDGTPDPNCSPYVVLKDLRCCFPAGTPYTVRASHQWLLSAAGGSHDLASGPDGRCVHTATCDLRKQFFHQRAFEVCNSAVSTCSASDVTLGCVVGNANVPIEPGGIGSQCIFQNLTSRFVVYRGVKPSTRGMSFTWQTTGGFAPLTMSLATQSTQVNPQSLVYIPELDQLAVIDGSTLGLSLFDLNSLSVVAPSPFF